MAQKTSYRLIRLACLAALLSWGTLLAAQGQLTSSQRKHEPASRVGTLHVEGQGIDLLVLRDDAGQEKTVRRPEAEMVLPPGRYRLERIVLQGGRSCRPGEPLLDRRLTVDPNTPATLRVGAPLRQVIEAHRQGSIMSLTYELVGQGGECYDIRQDLQDRSPAFAVYRGDRKVGSGDFEFG